MIRPPIRMCVLFLFASLALVACGGGQGGAPGAVEAYLEALVAKDADAVVNLSCLDWEEDAITEVDSFEAVSAELDGVTCQEAGSDGEFTLVSCTGSIVVTYDNEVQEIELVGVTYRAVQDGGQWRMCGYQF
jgi:hypothetical protein